MPFPPDLQAPYAVLLFIFGVIFGSFGNVLTRRIPEGMTIGGRSMCPRCKKGIALYDNVPLISYLVLRGKCRHCKKPISVRYPLIELASGLLFLSTVTLHVDLISQAVLALCLWLLLLISVVDAEYQGIPDALNIPFVLLAAVYSYTTGTFDWLSLTIGLGFLGGQWLVSLGKWVGSGDVILITGMALLVGIWPKMVMCLLFAYIIGAAVASILLLTGLKTRKDALPFAPFLSLSTMITVFHGQWILMYLF